jgi:hypothetical protein
LVIGAVSETLAVLNEKFRVETPSDNGASYNVVVAVGVCSVWYIEELPSPV